MPDRKKLKKRHKLRLFSISVAALLVPLVVLAQAMDLCQRLVQLAERGDIAGVTSSLGGGAKPDSANEKGITAPINAAWRGDAVMARTLLDAGATVDRPARAGCTPLIWAARNGKTETVQLLVANGASPFLEDGHGNNALTYAISQKEMVVARILAGRRDVDDLMEYRQSAEERVARTPHTDCGEAPPAAPKAP